MGLKGRHQNPKTIQSAVSLFTAAVAAVGISVHACIPALSRDERDYEILASTGNVARPIVSQADKPFLESALRPDSVSQDGLVQTYLVSSEQAGAMFQKAVTACEQVFNKYKYPSRSEIQDIADFVVYTAERHCLLASVNQTSAVYRPEEASELLARAALHAEIYDLLCLHYASEDPAARNNDAHQRVVAALKPYFAERLKSPQSERVHFSESQLIKPALTAA